MAAFRIVLASASPRRRELLARAGLEFEVEPSEVGEDLPEGIAPEQGAALLAERKARAVALRYGAARPARLVIGADTVVALDGPDGVRLLAKPADEAEARAMLGALSGSVHRVVTGVCVAWVGADVPGGLRVEVGAERTWVSMRPIAPQEIEAYVASGEWRDKAGGYAIQGRGAVFVAGLAGSYSGVMGLPLFETAGLLGEAGIPVWTGPAP